MTKEERAKAISAAVAEATQSKILPASIRLGLAAMGEELRELRADVDNLKGAKSDA